MSEYLVTTHYTTTQIVKIFAEDEEEAIELVKGYDGDIVEEIVNDDIIIDDVEEVEDDIITDEEEN